MPTRPRQPTANRTASRAFRTMAAAALVLALLAALPPSAEAETVRLRSGKTLEAASVVFLPGKIEATLSREGGTARILLRLDQLAADDLLPLWDRTHDPKDAAAMLAGADFALALSQRAEAARRFERAAQLDASLASRREDGLRRLRALETADALRDLERRIRRGSDARGAVILAEALLEEPQVATLRPAQARRARVLGELARRLVARDDARTAAALAPAAPPFSVPVFPAALPDPKPDPQPVAKPAVPAAAAGAPLKAIQERVAGFAKRASDAREAAADPSVRPRRALELLRRAGDAYLLARRLVREAPAAYGEALGELGEDLRLALVTTYLDLADLYRQEARYEAARAHVRAALILDPGNAEAWSQRRLIEDDLERATTPVNEGYRPAFETFYTSPSPFYGYGYGYGYSSRALRYGGYRSYGGLVVGFRSGRLRIGHQHGGGTRVVGRRR